MIVNGKKIRNGKKLLTGIRRDQITSATYRAVSRKGYYEVTVKDIARETGLSAGLILYYFKSKQDLLLNVFRETQGNVRDNLRRRLEKAEDPLGKLEIFIDESFLLFEREKDYFYLLFEFWTQLKRNKSIRQVVQKLYQAYRDELSVILEMGMKQDVFRDMDIQYTATLCVSMVQHTIIQHLIDDKAFDFQTYAARIKQCIMSLVLKDALPRLD
jgi:AcrR family transcriptional regulator